MNRFFAIVVMCFVLASAAGCGTDSDTSDTMAQLDTESRVAVENLQYHRLPNGSRVLSGVLVNTSARHIQNAQVQISLYDELNQGLGTTLIVVSDVDPGSEKAFRHTVDRDDVAGARVRSILAR